MVGGGGGGGGGWTRPCGRSPERANRRGKARASAWSGTHTLIDLIHVSGPGSSPSQPLAPSARGTPECPRF